jgi:hypothetical protein
MNIWKGFVVYLDDIIYFSDNIEEDDRLFEEVIKKLEKKLRMY